MPGPFNTGNPIGSSDPRDLFDNSTNLDELTNSQTKIQHPDRLGQQRKTWHGMETDFGAAQDSRATRFNDFIASSGYQFIGDYEAGITVTEYNQLIRTEADSEGFGEFWRASASTELPYTTTGAGMDEGGAFVSVGDANLRQQLASTDAGKGAELVAKGTLHVGSVAALRARSFPTAVDHIWLDGYYGVGTAGGGMLYRDSSDVSTTDNGGTVFVDDAGARWKRPDSKEYSADQFGARLDGSENAATILTNAFEHIPTGGTFFWPGGMKISSQVLCERGDITIEGDLGAITISEPYSSVNQFFRVQGQSESRIENVAMRNLRFVGDFESSLADFYSGGVDQRGGRVQFQHVNNVHIENIWGHRIDIAADVRNCDNAEISNIHVTESGMAVSIIRVKVSTISNCSGSEVTDSIVDYSQCEKSTVSNIIGVVSEAGEGFADEVIDAGQIRDTNISNVVSVGPFQNALRIKFDTVEDPSWHRVVVSNVNVYDHAAQAVFIASETEDNKEILIDGLRVESARPIASGVRRAGGESISRVHLSNFDIETSIRCIDLTGCDDVAVSDGAAVALNADTDAVLKLGFIDADRPGGRVIVSNVEVSKTGATNGVAVDVFRAIRPYLNNVRVVKSQQRDGIVLRNCISPRVRNCSAKEVGRHGIWMQATDPALALLSGRILGCEIEGCTVEKWGLSSASARGIYFQSTIDGDDLHVFRISGNTCFIDGDVTPDSQIGIQVVGSGTADLDHGKIDNNIVYGTAGTAISTSGLGTNVSQDGNITG